jgi:hypothetical protein
MTIPNTIAIVTDAWFPQVNGVVRTLSRIKQELEHRGHRVEVISPEGYRSVPCPTYPEIRLALFAARSVKQRLTALKPDAAISPQRALLGWLPDAGAGRIVCHSQQVITHGSRNMSGSECQSLSVGLMLF